MHVMTNPDSVSLWQDAIKNAENKCFITLKHDLETYLVTLLIRYTNRPEIAEKILATAYLKALANGETERHVALQGIGDECLIYAGLFPKRAEKRLVKVSYFVGLGRSAYGRISHKTNDLFGSLAEHFVILMDVLQSIREHSYLLPIEAHEQWSELGSMRAYRILEQYRQGNHLKRLK